MSKKELDIKLIEELSEFLPKILSLATDKAMPLLGKEAWRLGDKYGVSGDAIIHFLFDNYGDIMSNIH